MNKTKLTTCKLLELTRKAYQRHIMISAHLGEHFDIDYARLEHLLLVDYL